MTRPCVVLILGWFLSSAAAQDQTPRFSAQVEQVVVYASVYDDRGELVTGLEQEDFNLFEDKIEQQLSSFAQTEVPATVGLILDSSGSMRSKMRMVEEAVDIFLSQNNPRNELFFVRFDDEVELEEDFTREVEDVRDAIGNVVVRGGTALYDAVFLGVDKAQKGEEQRRVIIVFTDGEDKDSFYKHEEVLEKVRESDTQVFVVAFLDKELDNDKGFFGVFKSQRQRVEEEIKALAEVTGGEAFFPEATTELATVFEQIAKELRNQYRLAYLSSNPAMDGKWRRIDVRIKDAKDRGLRVRARKGYYASPDS